MTAVDLPRLRTTLGAPELERVVDALQIRMERGRPLTGVLTLNGISAAERNAIDHVLGRVATRGESLSLDLDALAETLRDAGICTTLAEAVEALRGPVCNRLALAAELEAAWQRVHAKALAAFGPWPALRPWLDELFVNGTLKRLSAGNPAEAARVLAEVASAAAALPVQAEPLAAFAARLFGDAHALDQGTALATLAVRVAALRGNVSFEDDAEGCRTAWASVGIVCDELSTPALVLNLPANSATPLGRLLRSARADGEPLHLSLRQLMLWPLATDPALAGIEIFVCENPTIVALAARRLGRGCPALVCVNGQFATPAKVLLRQLRGAGARLNYHGDFDVGGLRIAMRVFSEYGATPWKMSAADYLAAAKGKPIDANAILCSPWDPELASAMSRIRRAVHEEAVIDTLLADLGRRL